MTDMLTEGEVATILRKGTRTVTRLRRSGQLPYLPGKPILIPRQAVTDYLKANLVTDRPKRRVVRQVRLAHPRTKP